MFSEEVAEERIGQTDYIDNFRSVSDEMRAGLSTIQQTLTPEAATVLNQSIAEAGRRNHGQTTPLHVAATLLVCPTGRLRQACVQSHPNSSHPLQCRALDLCFSVALDRLPSAAPVADPPISNALMAALKRAQAHQRRGCPEQQHQPLLAVKVELEQLIVSILDDPSVSRVMREASFSSPAVKGAIEQSIASTSSSSTAVSSTPTPSSAGGLGFRPVMAATTTLLQPNRGLYINPRLQQQHLKPQLRGEEEVKKVLDVLVRNKKKNPVLVGDSDLQSLMKDVLGRIETECIDGPLVNSHVMSLEEDFASNRAHISSWMAELANSIDSRLDSGEGGVILNLGDLKWLVENSNGTPQQQRLLPEAGRAAVAEMRKLLARFNGGRSRVWLMGTATCETFLRCQVYHPTMESDWDLQAVPVAPRAPVPGIFPRNGGSGLQFNPVEPLVHPKGLTTSGLTTGRPTISTTMLPKRPPENADPARRTMCPACTEQYERELARLVAEEFEKASSNSKTVARQKLPPWLQAAKQNTATLQTREQELKWKQNTEGLLERWRETCSCLHPSFHHPVDTSDRPPLGSLPVQNCHKPKIIPLEPLPPTSNPVGITGGPTLAPAKVHVSPPGSPVRTDLVLGQLVTAEASTTEKSHKDHVEGLSGCAQDFFPKQQRDAFGGNSETDSFKRLLRGLTEHVAWQHDAAASVAITVTQCRSGDGRRKAARSNADTWLLFLGHDKVGKRKMASALSENLFGTAPTTVSLSADVVGRSVDVEDGGSSMAFHRKTALDRVAEAVRRNPFSVFVVEDVDRADALVRGSIKKAIEGGRLPDSHGREVSLGSGVFIVTADLLPDCVKDPSVVGCEEKLEAIAKCGWKLELLVGERSGKRRRCDWPSGADRPTRPRIDSAGSGGLSLDLNLATCAVEEDGKDGSGNSSDVTVEQDLQPIRLNLRPPTSSLPVDIMDAVDGAIVFKPVDLAPLRGKVSDTIIHKFNSVVGTGRQLHVDAEALERLVAGIWFGEMGVPGFDEWITNVLLPCFQQLRSDPALPGTSIVRLLPVKDERAPAEDWLPTKIMVAGGELHRA